MSVFYLSQTPQRYIPTGNDMIINSGSVPALIDTNPNPLTPITPGSGFQVTAGTQYWLKSGIVGTINSTTVYTLEGLQNVIQINSQPVLLDTLPEPGSISVAPGTSFSTGIINAEGFQSYNIAVNAFTTPQNTVGAPLTLQALITWFEDPAGNFPIYSERWGGWIGNSLANTSPVYGRGSMAGPFFSVQIANTPSAAQNLTLTTLNIFGSNASVGQSDWRQVPPLAINSGVGLFVPLPAAFGDDCILLSVNGTTIGANMTVWQPLPLAPGPFYIHLRTGVPLQDPFVLGIGQGLVNGQLSSALTSSVAPLWNNPTSTGSDVYGPPATIYAPRAPLYVIMHTTSTPAPMTLVITTKPPGT